MGRKTIRIKEEDVSARDQFKEILEIVGGAENIKEVKRNSKTLNVALKDFSNSNLVSLQDLSDVKEIAFNPGKLEEFEIVFKGNLAEIYDNLFRGVM